MNIAKRLVLLLAVPLVVFLALGGILDLNLKTIENRGTFVADLQLPSVELIGHATRKHAELRVDLRDYLLAPSDKERASVQAAFLSDEKDLDRVLDQYSNTLVVDERDRQLLNDFRELTGQWTAEANKLLALAESGKRQEALDRAFATLPALGERGQKAAGDWADYNE